MCGIAGVFLNPRNRKAFPLEDFCKKLLLEIESRGTDATGFVSVAKTSSVNPAITYKREAITATEFIKKHRIDANAHTVLLHTRRATQGLASDVQNNHPVHWNNCYVVHNGHIGNDDKVIETTIGKDKRVGLVDSFAIPTALDYHGWKNPDDIKLGLEMLQGPFAIAAINPIEMPGHLLLAKGDGSPLHVLKTPQGIFWASTKEALLNAWGEAIGTPPQSRAVTSNDYGLHDLLGGDYMSITQGKKAQISMGRFQINRPVYPTNVSHGYSYERYRRTKHDWTCWPDTKNCIFGDACGNCANADCNCFESNVDHPRMNNDTTFAEAIKKWPEFKRHCDKYKLAEEMIVPTPNPTKVLTLVSTPAISTTPSGSSGQQLTSGTSENASSSLGIRGAVIIEKCFFCNNHYPTANMRCIAQATRHNGQYSEAMYKCNKCDAKKAAEKKEPVVVSVTPVTGHSAKLDKAIARLATTGRIACEMIDTALLEVSWEYDLDIDFTRYACIFHKEDAEDTEFFPFQREIKDTFKKSLLRQRSEQQVEASK